MVIYTAGGPIGWTDRRDPELTRMQFDGEFGTFLVDGALENRLRRVDVEALQRYERRLSTGIIQPLRNMFRPYHPLSVKHSTASYLLKIQEERAATFQLMNKIKSK